MKILVIGDIHGQSVWKQLVYNTEFDHVIFMGDYFDSFNIPIQAQLENFQDILQYKRDNPQTVTLLFGNHDFHYMVDDEMYSGFNVVTKLGIEYILKDCIKNDELVLCCSFDKYLFSHAGVSKVWVENKNIDTDNLVQSVNDILKFTPRRLCFSENLPTKMSERIDYTGDNRTQSPIWIRPHSLLGSMLEGYYQVVGHTAHTFVKFLTDLTIVDALPYEALLIDTQGDMQVVKLS